MDAENRKREETLFHWNMVKGSQNTGKTKQNKTTRGLAESQGQIFTQGAANTEGWQRMGEVWEEEVNDGSQIDLCIRITERALIISKN